MDLRNTVVIMTSNIGSEVFQLEGHSEDEKGMTIQLTGPARRQLAEEGFDPFYGARPLKRAIQRRILDPLAMQVISGVLAAGSCAIINYDEGEFTFRYILSQAA